MHYRGAADGREPSQAYRVLPCSLMKSGDPHAENLRVGRPGRLSGQLETAQSQRQDGAMHPLHVFAANSRFKPERIEINGRKDRRLIWVLGNESRQYKVFDLDNQAEEVIETASDKSAHEDASMDDYDG